jgi:hypothetical protein
MGKPLTSLTTLTSPTAAACCEGLAEGANDANEPMKMPMNPNLSRRPARPSLNRGPVQRRAKYALWALGIASTSQIAEWTHVRARVRGLRSDNHTRSARRVLARIAVRVGRANTIGQPWLWRLREPE